LQSETKRNFVASIEKAHSIELRRSRVARLRNRADFQTSFRRFTYEFYD
jgi:hypothetical protein